MKSQFSKKTSLNRLWISLGLSAAVLMLGVAGVESIDPATAVRRLILPLGRLMGIIAVGLAAGQIIEQWGWTAGLGRLGAPLFRFARLGPHCSATFSTAFVSGTAANAMLYEFWKAGKINLRQLILTNLTNQFPAFFLHLPTTVFIVLPLAGRAGGIYLLLTFLAAVLRLLAVLTWAHRYPSASPGPPPENDAPDRKTGRKASVWAVVKQKLPLRLASVATYVVPIYVAVFLLNGAGLFDWTRQWMVQRVATGFVPIESLSLVVLGFAAEFTSGFAAAGALLHQGVLSIPQAVLALLIGNLVAFPIRALRHQLPRLMGIFAPRLGLQVLLLGQGTRIASLLLVGMAYYLMI